MRIFFIISCIIIGVTVIRGHGHGHSHGHDHDHDHHHHDHEEESEPPSFKYSRAANEHNHKIKQDNTIPPVKNIPVQVDNSDIWLYAISSTLVISAAPYLLLYFVPVDGTDEKKPLLKVLLAFASGGLLGDAFLHLIPHALSPHNHNEEHSHHSHSHNHDEHGSHSHGHHMDVGLAVLAGIITFLFVEKFVRLFNAGHGHSHGGDEKKKSDKKDKSKKQEKKPDIKIAGYLNLAADFTHNFTDGLAIGASYIAGNSIGLITTVTILLHEVPHEIGDFAILLQSGCSRRKAMTLQLVTAVGALAGTSLSLFLRDNEDLIPSSWILPFTAGGFIYIATVSVIPELLEDSSAKYGQSVKEILALLAGVGMMVLIALYE